LEINIRQRVIGGVVLIALAVIFIPLLFKSPASKPKHITMETSIPAAPAKPTMQTTITMQGEELNPQQNVELKDQVGNNVATKTDASTQQKQSIPQDALQPADINQTSNAIPELTTSTQTDSNKTATTVKSTAIDSEAIVEPQPEEQPTKPAKQQANKHNPHPKLTTIAAKTKTAAAHQSKVVTTASTKISEPKVQVAKAWVIQMGSFSDVKKAKTLEKQLRAKGYAAYTYSAKTAVGTMTRVYVGPQLTQAKAKSVLAKLDSNMHMKGVILPFEPTQVK